MWIKYRLNIIALVIVIIARITVVPLFLPSDYNPYPRIMTYQIRRDYPMFDLVNLRNLELASVRSGYSMETLVSIDLLTRNNLNIDRAKSEMSRELERMTVPATFRSELLELRMQEIFETYDRPVRMISILYEFTLIIIISTVFFYLLYYADTRRRLDNRSE